MKLTLLLLALPVLMFFTGMLWFASRWTAPQQEPWRLNPEPEDIRPP